MATAKQWRVNGFAFSKKRVQMCIWVTLTVQRLKAKRSVPSLRFKVTPPSSTVLQGKPSKPKNMHALSTVEIEQQKSSQHFTKTNTKKPKNIFTFQNLTSLPNLSNPFLILFQKCLDFLLPKKQKLHSNRREKLRFNLKK